MTEGLKPLPLPFSNDPLNLMRYRYRYRSADNQYYILAFFVNGLDGISRVSWSIYRYGHDDTREENMIGLDKDFDNMINTEEWINEGYEAVIAQ
jgi:hypothetical protein